jgi:hypothetical protein
MNASDAADIMMVYRWIVHFIHHYHQLCPASFANPSTM